MEASNKKGLFMTTKHLNDLPSDDKQVVSFDMVGEMTDEN